MKTLIRTIAILYIISVITSGISFAQVTSGTTATSEPVEKTDDAFTAGVRTLGTSGLPERPEKRDNETDASYQARIRAWDTEVRRLTSDRYPATVITTSVQPVRRLGESDEAYQKRIRELEAAILKQEEIRQQELKLQELQRILESASSTRSYNTGSTNTFGSGTDNMLVIPTGEMKTEDLLTINEDMNVMSQILKNELSPEVKATLGGMSFIGDRWVSTPSYGLFMNRDNDTLTSMYLQDYGALFLIKVDFPLTASPETQEQPEEPDKEDVDSVWEQTRQQIYQPQLASTTSANTRGPDIKYDAQRIENLKTTLIKALKHAANLRTLRPDESVILRISGSGQSINIISVKKDGNQLIVNFESNGSQHLVIISGDLEDYIKSLSTPTVILIRAKKSDIDTFAKGELDLEKFRQRVQILSYPLLQNALPSTTTGRTSVPVPFGTTGTRGTTSSWDRRTSRTSEAPPTQPANETDNGR